VRGSIEEEEHQHHLSKLATNERPREMIAENWQKSLKIVITTSTPAWPYFSSICLLTVQIKSRHCTTSIDPTVSGSAGTGFRSPQRFFDGIFL
jgi:hypothetical protein